MIGTQAERERLDEFVRAWSTLRERTDAPGSVVLVEGEKDRRALRRLGFASPIALVHQGRRLPEIAQSVARGHARAIVLTDWDRKGGQLAERLTRLLEGADLEVDREVRERFARALAGELVHVEGLYQWANRLADTLGVALGSLLDEDGADLPTGPTG